MKNVLITLLFVSCILVFKSSFAQCGAVSFQGTITPTPTSQNTPSLNSGRPYWEFSATSGCSYTFSTCSSAGDTYLRLYNSAWVLQAENDDDCSVRSTINWTCTTTGTYRILLTNWSCDVLAQSTFVSYIRSCPWDPPLNDNCAGATSLPLDECNWTAYNLKSTSTNSGVSDPNCISSSWGVGYVHQDIWYRFTASSSTTVVEATNNTAHMALQVYSGACGSLQPVTNGCSDGINGPGTAESVAIATNVGGVYYVRIMRTNVPGTPNDMIGSIRAYPSSSHANQGVFGTVTANNSRGSAPNLTLNGSPNTCADVGTLRTGRIQVRSLGTATRDNSIADQSCFLVGQTTSSNRNVWARVTIPSGSSINGLYFYSTIEGVCPQPSSSTNLRTGYINVYTGTSSCTPNSPCGGAWDNIITSYNFSAPYIETQGTERIDVVPGQTYYIEIWTTSFGNDPNFNFDVHVVPLGNPPGNENCNNALAFSGSGVGCNLGADPACTGYTIPCMATVENSVFYTYESPGTPFQIEVENVVCEGGAQDLQAGIFEMNAGTCLGNLTGSNLVGSACFTGNYSFDINAPLPAGSDYLIWFDGNAGAACTWGLTILPIEFKDYSVTCDDDGVIFNWSTYSEHNNDFFSIEVSSDGSIFETIGIMDAIGNSISQSDYSMRFDSPQRGNWYYRLSQTDFDGKKTILGTLSSEWPCKDGDNEPYLFPNPARDEVNVLFESNGRSTYSVEVFNSLGQLVLPSISGEFKGNGQKMIKVTTNDLSAGSFIVRIMEGEKMYTRLLILE